MWVGSLISLIVWGIICGVATNKVIEKKCYSDNWFWWGFFFGFLALIVACTKPQAQSYNSSSSSLFAAAAEEKMKIQQQSLLEQGGWKCNKCGNVNPSYSGTCNCGNLKASNQTKEIEDKRETENFQKMKSYKDLLDSGVITQEEFDAKKEQLLGLSEIKKIAEADEPLLKRAFMFLEDGNWSEADSYCEKVLDQDPENAQAYLGKLMAEVHVRQLEDFLNCDLLFNNSNNYQKAVRFGGEELAGILSGYIEFFIERNEKMRLTDVYNNAVIAMNAAKTESAYKAVAKTFKTISGFQDANTLAEQCLERAEDCRKDAIYASARSQMTGNAVSGYEAAIKEFSTISSWKDADEQIYACQRKIEEIKAKEEADRLENEHQAELRRIAAKKRKRIFVIIASIIVACIAFVIVWKTVIIPTQKYNAAVELFNAGKYDEAIIAFTELNGYKDSFEQIENCKYTTAVELYNAGKYDEAKIAFAEISGYKDSSEQVEKCKTAIKDEKYAAAVELYNAGKYEAAISEFTALQEYKDSKEQIEKCKTAIKDEKYAAAVELYNAGEYEKAIYGFKALNGYKDSSAQLEKCETAIKDKQYNAAVEALNNGNVIEGYERLMAIRMYKDSAEKAKAVYLKYVMEKLKTASVGDIVLYGAYEQDNNTLNGKEDLEWIVLAKKGDKVLLLSRYCLDCQKYNSSYRKVTWEKCTLRSWLNRTFLKNAFSADERAKISTTRVSADKNPEYSTNPGKATKDKVFLLSIKEAKKYFTTDFARWVCKGTEYCYAQGAKNGSSGNCWWWLRSPGCNQYDASYFSSDPSFGYAYVGNAVERDDAGVRPALWIKLK